MAEKLGWDAAEQERQVMEYKRQVELTRSFKARDPPCARNTPTRIKSEE